MTQSSLYKSRDNSNFGLVPEKSGDEQNYFLYFDTSRKVTIVSSSDDDLRFSEHVQQVSEAKKLKAQRYQKINDTDLTKLSSAALSSLATKVTKYGLQKTHNDYLNEYFSAKCFKPINLLVMLYHLVLPVAFILFVNSHWEADASRLCITAKTCISLKLSGVYFLSGMLICLAVLYCAVLCMAFRAYNARSINQFALLQLIYIFCLIICVLTMNVLAIPLTSYLLFTTIRLNELCRKMAAIERFRSRTINFS